MKRRFFVLELAFFIEDLVSGSMFLALVNGVVKSMIAHISLNTATPGDFASRLAMSSCFINAVKRLAEF
jgi:hypothetical protein